MRPNENLPVDPASPSVYFPPGESDKSAEKRIAYRFRLPSVADRLRFRRAVAARGGRRPGERDMLDEARAGLAHLLGADSAEYEAAAGVIARYEAVRDGFYARVRAGAFADDEAGHAERRAGAAELAAAARAFEALETVLRERWPAYAEKLADKAVYEQIAGLAAIDVLGMGWDNLTVEFRRGPNGVPEECLAAVPEWHLQFIAGHVEGLFEPREAQAKN